MNQDFFHLIYTYLEERASNNVSANLNSDEDYQNAMERQNRLYREYDHLNLSKEQRKVIEEWIDAIYSSNSAYTMVAFRMGMQYCFSILMELADLEVTLKTKPSICWDTKQLES